VVSISATADDDAVTLTIADNGPGIPENELTAIETGTETSLAHTSGLGLWLINWGAFRLGGDVSFAVDDTGTAVTLSIPRDIRSETTRPLASDD